MAIIETVDYLKSDIEFVNISIESEKQCKDKKRVEKYLCTGCSGNSDSI